MNVWLGLVLIFFGLLLLAGAILSEGGLCAGVDVDSGFYSKQQTSLWLLTEVFDIIDC